MNEFIKQCGPYKLRSLSTGKILVMIEEAINRNILKHQKTYLVYTGDLIYRNLNLIVLKNNNHLVDQNRNKSTFLEEEITRKK